MVTCCFSPGSKSSHFSKQTEISFIPFIGVIFDVGKMHFVVRKAAYNDAARKLYIHFEDVVLTTELEYKLFVDNILNEPGWKLDLESKW